MSSIEEQSVSSIAVDVDHNPYLAEGAGTVDAIVSIAVGSEMAAADKPPERVEAIIIDCSTSMLSPQGKFDEAKRATTAAVNEIVDGTYFIIAAGTDKAVPVYPADGRPTQASEATRAAAARAVDGLQPKGGTAMGTWLAHVRRIARQHPGALTHAILLTDGKDEHENPEQLGEEIGLSEGEFTCDCRGVGTDWHVEELRAISSALLGTVDIVADPADLADDFAAMMRASMGKSIPDLTLRLWAPAAARVAFVKQVAPTVEDLTHRRVDAGNQCGEYPLGPWGAEERDYHIQVGVEPAAAGREKLAARVTVVAGDESLGEGLVKGCGPPTRPCRPGSVTGSRTTQARRSWRKPSRTGWPHERTGTSRPRPQSCGAQWNSPWSRVTTGRPSCSEGSSKSTSARVRPGCDAISPRQTRWPSTRDRPEPRECGRRPDAHLYRRPRHSGR